MEGSKGEAAFSALGLNPQLFINGILNMVDDGVEAAFEFFHKEALKLLDSSGNGSSNKSDDLVPGISSLRCSLEGVLDKQMSMWEKYCLMHCFSVPEEFIFPERHDSSGNHSKDFLHPEASDEQLDLELDTLRSKLAAAGQKNAELQREIHSLEMKSQYDSATLEVVQLYEENSVPQMYKEIGEAASKLNEKMEEFRMKMKYIGEGQGILSFKLLKDTSPKHDERISLA
ncbi:hypothetical protein AXF42_Ash008067 [Apostasia shenzhenica]|uniref:Protein MIS12 homolog n=1 Tax=Apostasia shenzhenica TaxID=1088818 RepID=A0A2I0A8H6_9ASPA|nr:hypothetical protein AXF42_Ash008067 [Apostasia shenzhenica]